MRHTLHNHCPIDVSSEVVDLRNHGTRVPAVTLLTNLSKPNRVLDITSIEMPSGKVARPAARQYLWPAMGRFHARIRVPPGWLLIHELVTALLVILRTVLSSSQWSQSHALSPSVLARDWRYLYRPSSGEHCQHVPHPWHTVRRCVRY